jgi:tRNA G18 (ribose-2'-O)-methylase SpoU
MNFAIVMGSEKSGISNNLLKKSDFKVKIPMYNDFESLNVANAASIIMYEAIRQIIQKSKLIV